MASGIATTSVTTVGLGVYNIMNSLYKTGTHVLLKKIKHDTHKYFEFEDRRVFIFFTYVLNCTSL